MDMPQAVPAKPQRPQEVLTAFKWSGWCLVGLGVALLASILLFLPLDPNRFVTALLWALACLGSSMAVGFLFGVPRVDQKKKDQAAQ